MTSSHEPVDRESVDASGASGVWRLQCPHCRHLVSVDATAAGQPHSCEHCGDYLLVPKQRVAPGAVIGDYVLHEKLGTGGRGTVFKAHQRSLDRLCAVKILHPHYSEAGLRHDELIREARLAARLNHPCIVQCYAVGDSDGLVYYAMEFVSGRSLHEILRTRIKLLPSRALDIARQVALALDYAWKEQRLVHRDIKPDNVMIADDGTAKLADFGLARPVHELSDDEDNDVVSGTPQYMCPEQILSEPMDCRGDMYSLGVILYLAITGKSPFAGASQEAILRKHLEEYPPYPHVLQPNLPMPVSRMIMAMLAKSPDDRYPDFESVIRIIDECRPLCPDPGSSTVITRSDVLASQTLLRRSGAGDLAGQPRRSPRALKVISPGDSGVYTASDIAPIPVANDESAGTQVRSISELRAAAETALPETFVEPSAEPKPGLSRSLTIKAASPSSTSVPASVSAPATAPSTAPSTASVVPQAVAESTAVPQTADRAAEHDDAPTAPPAAAGRGWILALAGVGGVAVVIAAAVMWRPKGGTVQPPDASAVVVPPLPINMVEAVPTSVDASEPAATPVPLVAPAPSTQLRLVALLPDPAGYDPGHEWVDVQNLGATAAPLAGWRLRDEQNDEQPLDGELAPDEVRRIPLTAIGLNNGGDGLTLLAPDGKTIDRLAYIAAQVVEGQPVNAPPRSVPTLTP